MTTQEMVPEAALVLDQAQGPTRFPLRGQPVVVGRDAGSDVRLADRSLSGRHCRLEPVVGGWKIVDLESRNGTFVNEALVKQRRLAHGDRLRLGRVNLSFEVAGQEQDLINQVTLLVRRIHRRFGTEGLLEAAQAFATSANEQGVSGLLANAEEVRAAAQLQSVVTAMAEERRPEAVLGQIVDTLIEFTGAERGFFLQHERDPEGRVRRRIVAARNFDREEVTDALEKVSRTIERRAHETGDPVLVVDAPTDERFSGSESIVDMRLRSILCVPVRGPAHTTGSIYLDNRFERGVFSERHIPLLKAFADQAAVAIWNASLHAENEARLEALTTAKAEVEELNRILADRVAQTSAELMEVKEHVLREREEAPLKYSYRNILGTSRAMRDVFLLLDKVTDSDVPVLVQGESGTGKELVARALHFNGARKAGPFVSENCAAIPETLLESELFGYQKGAFTGATSDRKGLFEAANGGTIFLDEIGDMPLDMQKKLLRVLQEREVRRVGGNRAIPIDVRVVAASNQDLRKACAEGRFREDLYFRLAVITVDLPPLRDRREDIPLLVEHFLGTFAQEAGVAPLSISDDAMRALVAYHWPGNVRELRNEVQRAAALSDRVIVPLILSPNLAGARSKNPAIQDLGRKALREMVREVTEELERAVIEEALRRSQGRKARAARLLGVSRPTLDAKIEAYHIDLRRPA
jgi:transcriptional regulator with GAF, ATPase, and Fis domain